MPLAAQKTRPLPRAVAWSGAALVLAALLVVIAHSTAGFQSSHGELIEGWIYDFITMAAAVATIVLAARREDERLPWLLLGIGLLSWAAGDLYTTIDADPPFPSVGDALYLAGYGPILAGILVYVRSRVGPMTAIVWTDVTMGALCVAAIGSSVGSSWLGS